MDDAVGLLHTYGTGAIMAKTDLKSAFRMVPVRPADWDLLGMFWDGMHYVDTCLPFGLCSAPYLFNHFADALHWVLAIPPLSKSHSHFVKGWGFLLPLRNWRDHQHKSTSWALSWIRRPAKVLSLPQDKLRDILQMVQSWLGRHKSTKHELLSLIGKLSFAAKVVPAGCLFVRR